MKSNFIRHEDAKTFGQRAAPPVLRLSGAKALSTVLDETSEPQRKGANSRN